ncbi:MAG TPA: cupin-like domain-containing protein, partial [Usitatibacter sp.]|nr:cupin-like domain-containing protein [Usitatibacter sp.]
MSTGRASMGEAHDVDAAAFARIVAGYRPAAMRALVAAWPAVRHGLESAPALAKYLGAFESGREVDAIRLPPSARGRIFYNADMSGFNYTREKLTIAAALDRAMKNARFENGAALAVQSAPIPDCLPG